MPEIITITLLTPTPSSVININSYQYSSASAHAEHTICGSYQVSEVQSTQDVVPIVIRLVRYSTSVML